MPPRPSNTTRELLTLYARAGHGEHNIGAFFRDHPELAAGLGVLDLDRDDADLALQLAPTIGKYKNLPPHPEERGAAVLVVDLRAPAPRTSGPRRTGPVLIAEVLAGLGFF